MDWKGHSEMNDRELLELAAKAAGIYGVDPVGDDDLWSDGTRTYRDEDGIIQFEPPGMRLVGGIWNPLTDDGDALRLAVKIGFSDGDGVSIFFADQVDPTVVVRKDGSCGAMDLAGKDPYAATRRAIVRAAAEQARALMSP